MNATWTVKYQDFAGNAFTRIVNMKQGDTPAQFMASDFGANLPAQDGPPLGCGKQAFSPKGAILQLLGGRPLVSATPNI